MSVGTAALRPAEHPIGLGDRQVVDARDSTAHRPGGVEFPVLVAVAPEPVIAVIGPFVGEANGDPIAGERPHFLDEAAGRLVSVLEAEAPHRRDHALLSSEWMRRWARAAGAANEEYLRSSPSRGNRHAIHDPDWRTDLLHAGARG
jgi:hypothetical protein